MDLVSHNAFPVIRKVISSKEINIFLLDIQGESSNIIINAYEAPGQTSSSESFMAKPKRVLYFSDGVMEQSSSDEECVHQVPKTSPLVDPVSFAIIIAIILHKVSW